MDYNYNRLPYFKWFVLQNFPFIEADFDAITNYELYCKIVEYLNKVIERENNIGNQVESLTNAFNNLTNYVDNYFKNLDVQDEINNKLDEMAEGGELTEIISEYLNLNAIIAFNTVDDMELATNAIDGSFFKIYGKDTYNDGKGAFYKVRTLINTDVIDGDNLVALTNFPTLVAEKIQSYIDNEQNTKISALETRTNFEFNERTVLIGDSYGYDREGLTGWMNRLQIKLGLSNENCIKCPAWAGGFVAKENTTSYLQALQNANISNKNTVKNIVVVGGDNDRWATDSQISTAMTEFISYVNNNFPNAIIFIGMFMYCADSNRFLDCMDRILPVYSNLMNYNKCVYLNDIQYAVRKLSFLGPDNVHLNETGQKQLTQCIYECLKTGKCTVNYKHNFFELSHSHTYDSINGYAPFVERHTDKCVVGFNDYWIDYDHHLITHNFKTGDSIDMGTWTNDEYFPFENVSGNFLVPVWYNINEIGGYMRTISTIEFTQNRHWIIHPPAFYGMDSAVHINRIMIKGTTHTVSSLLC